MGGHVNSFNISSIFQLVSTREAETNLLLSSDYNNIECTSIVFVGVMVWWRDFNQPAQMVSCSTWVGIPYNLE